MKKKYYFLKSKNNNNNNKPPYKSYEKTYLKKQKYLFSFNLIIIYMAFMTESLIPFHYGINFIGQHT